MADPKVTTTTTDWKAIVEAVKERNRKGKAVDDEPIAYEFSGNRKFKEHTDPYHWAKD